MNYSTISMKIGIDCRTILNPGKGEQTGIGHYTYYLVKSLLETDSLNEYVLFFDNRISDKAVKLMIGNHPQAVARFFPFYYYSFYLPANYSQLLTSAFISREKLDILHSPANTIPLRYEGKTIVTVHDLAIYKNADWFPSNFLSKKSFSAKILMSQSLRRADKIIAVSENTKRDIVKIFKIPEKKIEVIYEGVVTDQELRFKENREQLVIPGLNELRGKFGLKNNYVLFIGTIEPRKNLATLIKAWRSFLTRQRLNKKSCPPAADCQLVLAGGRGWKYKEVFKAIKEFKVSQSVRYLDYVSHQEKIGLLENAFCFIFPSLYEGFGLPVLEAMSLGAPVIASNVASIPEVAGKAALLINPKRALEITQALEKIFSDEPLRRRLSQAGQEQAKKFSWEKTARQTLNVYREITTKV